MATRFTDQQSEVLTALARTLLDQVVILGFAADVAADASTKAALQDAKVSQARLLHDVAAHIWRLGMAGVEHTTAEAMDRLGGLTAGQDHHRIAFDALHAKEADLMQLLVRAQTDDQLGGHLQNFLRTVLSRCETVSEQIDTIRPLQGDAAASDTLIARPLHILLVEDNPAVAAVTTEMLEHLGWKVTRAENTIDALQALSSDIDVLFSDVMLPGSLGGLELARAARQRRPSMPIVLSTGYTERVRQQASDAGIPLLSKPYGLDELSAAINESRPR